MNKRPSVTVIAALLLVNACGSRIGAVPVVETATVTPTSTAAAGDSTVDARTIDPEPVSPITTTPVVTTDPSASLPDLAVGEPGSAPDADAEPSNVAPSPTTTTPTTTITTVDSAGPETPTTQPPAEVDLDALTDALHELDALLGLFDSQVDAVDLDETEGETP